MHVQIRGDRPASEDLKEHVSRHLYFALSRYSGRIDWVHVALRDENGPRGGLDKTCRVAVHLPRLQPVLVTESASNWFEASARAAERAGRAVARALDRTRDHHQAPAA